MITVTDAAKDKIRSLMTKRQTPGHYLRIALQGGGCSGFMYSYDLVPEPDVGNWSLVPVVKPAKAYPI